MKQPSPKAIAQKESTKAPQVCITLDARAVEDLDNISAITERKSGAIPSRSAIVRMALRAYYEAVK